MAHHRLKWVNCDPEIRSALIISKNPENTVPSHLLRVETSNQNEMKSEEKMSLQSALPAAIPMENPWTLRWHSTAARVRGMGPNNPRLRMDTGQQHLLIFN